MSILGPDQVHEMEEGEYEGGPSDVHSSQTLPFHNANRHENASTHTSCDGNECQCCDIRNRLNFIFYMNKGYGPNEGDLDSIIRRKNYLPHYEHSFEGWLNYYVKDWQHFEAWGIQDYKVQYTQFKTNFTEFAYQEALKTMRSKRDVSHYLFESGQGPTDFHPEHWQKLRHRFQYRNSWIDFLKFVRNSDTHIPMSLKEKSSCAYINELIEFLKKNNSNIDLLKLIMTVSELYSLEENNSERPSVPLIDDFLRNLPPPRV